MAPNIETYLIVFVAITGFSVLLQALVLFAIFLALKKVAKTAQDATDDIKATVLPAVHSTKELIQRMTPQIITISAGMAELTELLRKESKGVSHSASEIMERVNRQSKRLDGMLTEGLNAVEKAGVVVESAVAAPVRQINGIMAAIKAVIETYRSESPRPRPTYPKPTYPNADNDPVL
jgi:methyl-accepting chemotaxis protein